MIRPAVVRSTYSISSERQQLLPSLVTDARRTRDRARQRVTVNILKSQTLNSALPFPVVSSLSKMLLCSLCVGSTYNTACSKKTHLNVGGKKEQARKKPLTPHSFL